MTHSTPIRLRRAIFAALVLAAMTAATFAFLAPPIEAAPAGNCTYYNNANHTTVVGQYGYDCCNNYVAWGKRTSYYQCGGCFICFPPPR